MTPYTEMITVQEDYTEHCLHVQNDSVTHPAFYPMGTGDSFPGIKAAGARSLPLISISCRGEECMEL